MNVVKKQEKNGQKQNLPALMALLSVRSCWHLWARNI